MWASIIGALIAAIGTGVGAAVNANAVGDAQDETRDMYNEQTRYDRAEASKTNRFNRRMQTENLELAERRQDESETNTAFNMSQSQLDKTRDIINRNAGLRNLTIQRWGSI